MKADKNPFPFTLVPQYHPHTLRPAFSPQHRNQSAWQNGSSGGLIDALIQWLSSCSGVESAESKHCAGVISGPPLKQESGAQLTERL